MKEIAEIIAKHNGKSFVELQVEDEPELVDEQKKAAGYEISVKFLIDIVVLTFLMRIGGNVNGAKIEQFASSP